MKYKSREDWLARAVGLMTPLFQAHEYKVPPVKVACGWPSARGLSSKKRTIGQCWDKSASSDKLNQIFISPWLEKPDDGGGVLATLVHEVVHAVVGIKEGHNKTFGKCARAVGLEGKLTATTASKELQALCKGWVKELGAYPHGKLDQNKSPVKKQGTRLLKCECDVCGYICRTTKKWLLDVGAPLCPTHKKPLMHEPLEEDEDEGGDE